jgi:hypothetical protein
MMGVTAFLELIHHQGSLGGDDKQQAAMFSYLTLARRIPADHLARQILAMADLALARLDAEFEKLPSTVPR